MYTVSQTLQTALNNGTPQRVLLEFMNASGTVTDVFSNEDIVVSTGVELDEMFNSETDLTIGLCPSAEIRFDMLNDNGQLEDFGFGKCKVWLGARIDSGTPSNTAKTKTFTGGKCNGLFEFTPLGVFLVERPSVVKKKIITITANDQMQLFDEDWPGSAALILTYPTTLSNLFTKLCAYVGVAYASASFLNSDITVSAEPEAFENATMREVLGWIAEAACSVARFNRDGQLEMAWFSTVNSVYDEHNYTEFSPAWYETKAVDKLNIRNADSETEYTYGSGSNAYMIQDNPFLRQQETTQITITQQPISQSGKTNTAVLFTVDAVNADTYRWQSKVSGGSWTDIADSNTNYNGAGTGTLSFLLTSSTAGKDYRCRLSNATSTATSNSASATITT